MLGVTKHYGAIADIVASRAAAEAAYDRLVEAFAPRHTARRDILRGRLKEN